MQITIGFIHYILLLRYKTPPPYVENVEAPFGRK